MFTFSDMASLKQKLEQAAIELADAKRILKQKQDAWDLLYRQATGGRASKKESNQSQSETGDSGVIGGVTERIVAILASDTSKEWKYKEIHKKLEDVPIPSLRAMMFKLQKDQKAIKAGRGRWKAATVVNLVTDANFRAGRSAGTGD